MIIPTLVLVSAMQFGDPQSGARIDDLSHSPWREIPAVSQVSYTAQVNETQNLSQGSETTGPPQFQPNQMQTVPNTTPGYTLGVPDPDLVPESVGGSAFPPLPSSQPPVSQPMVSPTLSPQWNTATSPMNGASNGSLANTYLSGSGMDNRGTTSTRVENNKVFLSRGAKVEFDKIARLSAPMGGIMLEQSTVKYDAQGNVIRASNGEPIKIELQRGVQLFSGQQIGQLDDRYPKAQYEVAVTKLAVAKKEAAQTISIDYARASLKVAESDYKRSWDVNTKTPGVVPTAELEFKAFKVEEARLQLEKAIIDHENQQESVKIQEQEVKVAQTQIDLRKVKTPFNAVVVNVISEVGNYLRESDPIAEVAMLDKLKVVADVDGKMVTQEQVDGKRATITVTDAPGGQNEQFEGFVRYAAPTFKDTRRVFEVEIEVDNRRVNGYWLLKEGDYVDVVIHL